MSDQAAAYQEQITGVPARVNAYSLNGVKFDGYDAARGVLLDAKGPGYATFVGDNGAFQPWYRGSARLLDEADRQLRAARGVPIEWHVAELEARNAIAQLLGANGYGAIRVIYTPPV